MSWRTVMITKPSKLDYSMGYLVVRNIEGITKIHLSEISLLIVENTATSVTCALMSKLIDDRIKVIFCDGKRNPQSELTAYYGSHDCSQKLKNQLEWSPTALQQAWTVIVAQKIKNQCEILRVFDLPEYQKLEMYLDELEFYDATNREGMAAKVYFNALFGKSFSRNDDTAVNAALNYGYSILLSCFNREIVCSGYLTQLGLFHSNMYNQYNLSCDLMEPFRPIVDCRVKRLNVYSFERTEKLQLIALLNEEFIIGNRTNTLLNAIKVYTKSVFSAIEGEDMALIKFPQMNDEL